MIILEPFYFNININLKKLTNYNSLLKFLEEKRNEIRLMEDTYIASRYLVREYTESEAKNF